MPVAKGPKTREKALEQARGLAARRGLDGVSLADLARECGLSKSGLYAHFESKEGLQLAVIDHAAADFQRAVIGPALEAERGEARLRALVDEWRRWAEQRHAESGCFFLQASIEFDDQEGAVRARLAEQQGQWMGFLRGAAQRAIDCGHFRSEVKPHQFAFELHGLYMAWHHAKRMMRDPLADSCFESSFDDLLTRARASRPRAKASRKGDSEHV